MVLFLIISLIGLKWIGNILGLVYSHFMEGMHFQYTEKNSWSCCISSFSVMFYIAGAHNDSGYYSFLSPLLGQKIYIACNFFLFLLLCMRFYLILA